MKCFSNVDISYEFVDHIFPAHTAETIIADDSAGADDRNKRRRHHLHLGARDDAVGADRSRHVADRAGSEQPIAQGQCFQASGQ